VNVADQGDGVRLEDRAHIFNRFWRARGSQGVGAGLGLAIVGEIMKAHGGTVDVNDAVGGGAVFTIRFPVARALLRNWSKTAQRSKGAVDTAPGADPG
jgi:signal transduction histidine kinase